MFFQIFKILIKFYFRLDVLVQLLMQTEDEKAVAVIKLILALEKRRRARSCGRLLSSSICRNNSAAPFHLWAKYMASVLTEDPSQQLREQLLQHVGKINNDAE